MNTQALELSYWAADTGPELFHGAVGDLLRRSVAAFPDRLALIEGAPAVARRRTWTYSELLDAAEQGARALLSRFAPGERIAVWAPNSPEWLILQQAAALAGLVLVTVNPAYRYLELEYVLRHSEVAALFHADDYRGANLRDVAARACEEIDTLSFTSSLTAWAEFVATGDPATPLPRIHPEAVAMVQYTSGTTGSPKGVLIGHQSMVNSAYLVARRAGIDEGCVYVNPMPTFHIGSCGTVTLGTISKFGTQVIAERFEPGLTLELLEACRANVVLAVPTMLIAMLEHPDMCRRDLSALSTVLTGGSTASADLVRRVKQEFDCRFSITFGQTETSGPSTQTDPEGSVWEQVETIGRALPHTDLKIVDPVTGGVVPVGVEGEICSRAPMTMLGYLKGTAESSLHDDGWLHYGDLGSMDADGYVRITGRLKDMIIRGGENISPREIEEVLCSHALVADAAVVGIPQPKWGEEVAAVVRVAPNATPPSQADLASYCAARLASHKVPVVWKFVTELPLTPSGKVQKFKLRQSLS